MRIIPGEKKAVISVGEFASFREIPVAERGPQTGPWRAALGLQWHQQAEAQQRELKPQASFEVPLEVTWLEQGWQLQFQGRIDQWIPTRPDTLEIVEVKTISRSLPAPAEELEQAYASYFRQLATYCFLARQVEGAQDLKIEGRLCFIDINNGIQQVVPLRASAESHFNRQMQRLLPFLEARHTAHLRLKHFTFQPAFADYREGQRETLERLREDAAGHPVVLLEAPTGFGKTGIVLEYALEQLRDGLYDRVIYLTSKSTGQVQAVRQLDAMLNWAEGGPRYFQIRNRGEHGAAHDEPEKEALDAGEIERRWQEAGLRPWALLDTGPLPLERILEHGERTGIPPYEITRSVLPFAEIWVGDINYIFAPSSRMFLENQPGFDPNRTLLIIDEAHNLPSRVADALSFDTDAPAWEAVRRELAAAGAPIRLTRAVDSWIGYLRALKRKNRLEPSASYDILDRIEAVISHWMEAPMDWSSIHPEAVDLVFKLVGLRDLLHNQDLDILCWSPHDEQLEVTCLDAAPTLSSQLLRFGHSILMSATLHPVDVFTRSCGLAADQRAHIRAPAPWRAGAYDVAIDSRVSTRFRDRASTYGETAETLARTAMAAAGPVAVFFPSYRYAEQINAYLGAAYPLLRTIIQERRLSLSEQVSFIESAIRSSDLLLLVLGTGYSEGIDAMGGAVSHAVVVGPALPEVNAVQEARMEGFPETQRTAAFREVYQIPAMQKINQALGRLVRAPGQRARVLLHGERFRESTFQELLDPEYQGGPVIRSAEALQAWLDQAG